MPDRNSQKTGEISRREDRPFALDQAWRSLGQEMDEMRRMMDRFVGNLGSGLFGEDSPIERGMKRVGVTAPGNADLYETDEEFRLSVDVAGIDQNDLDLSVSEDRVTVKGERKSEQEQEEGSYHWRSSSHGTFSRSYRLPESVDPDRVKASLKNGVLKVTLPKLEARKSKRVIVESEE